MKSIIKSVIALSLFILVFEGCYYDKADKLYPVASTGCDTSNATFSLTVAPILTQNCAIASCHDAASQAGGYNFTVYADVKTAVESGMFIGDIYQQSGFNPMPKQGSKLSSCDLSKISAWVNAGTLNN